MRLATGYILRRRLPYYDWTQILCKSLRKSTKKDFIVHSKIGIANSGHLWLFMMIRKNEEIMSHIYINKSNNFRACSRVEHLLPPVGETSSNVERNLVNSEDVIVSLFVMEGKRYTCLYNRTSNICLSLTSHCFWVYGSNILYLHFWEHSANARWDDIRETQSQNFNMLLICTQ